MSTCRSCGAEVIFVPSAKTGKPMILDAKPGKGVILRIVVDGIPAGPIPRDDLAWHMEADRARAQVVDVYTDHHVTCPDAAAWKGKARKVASTP